MNEKCQKKEARAETSIEEEMKQHTECLHYTPTPFGNLINSGTQWTVEGSLIKKIEVEESEISCSNR